MNPEVKYKFVRALRSGKYKQTTGALSKVIDGERCFCAVGVLCEIYREEHPDSPDWDDMFFMGVIIYQKTRNNFEI